MPISSESRLDLGAVLTSPSGERYLVVDAIGGKTKLCFIPAGCEATDYGVRFFHRPEPGDPTRSVLADTDD